MERKREEEERAARRKSEVGEVQSALGNIQKSVESSSEAVRDEGKRSKRKEEKILAVRDKADKVVHACSPCPLTCCRSWTLCSRQSTRRLQGRSGGRR